MVSITGCWLFVWVTKGMIMARLDNPVDPTVCLSTFRGEGVFYVNDYEIFLRVATLNGQ